jgi:tRNA-specific 2-thiouridylase
LCAAPRLAGVSATVDPTDPGGLLADHLERPRGRGLVPDGAVTGAAGGAVCGDLVRVSVLVDRGDPDGRILAAGFDASGCGAVTAAGSAVVELVTGVGLLEAARIGADEIAAQLGGLMPAKRHAAELAADALHRALGGAARDRARLAACAGRTVVALSGGVDSAVAALLLAREGHDVVAVTLELWSDAENDGELSCCSAQAVRLARSVAHGLQIPHFSIDLRAEFRAGVVDAWLSDHADGLTPNPCVRCNGSVRLDAMLAVGDRLGASTLATGHYARREDGLIARATDPSKDQSYTLCALAPASVERLRFPLGELTKREVRAIAAGAGLPVASRRDSQDLCFLAGTGSADFLERHLGVAPVRGPIIDEHGRPLGEHAGVHTYTVGQRRGLGLGAAAPFYVLRTDAPANTVVVGPRERLLADRLTVRDLTLHRPSRVVDAVRLRAHGRTLPCRLPSLAPGRHRRAEVVLQDPVERTAPGQIACLYASGVVVGHGTIAEPRSA